MNVAEEVPPWLGLEEKVENLRGTKALIKDTVRWIVRDKDVKSPTEGGMHYSIISEINDEFVTCFPMTTASRKDLGLIGTRSVSLSDCGDDSYKGIRLTATATKVALKDAIRSYIGSVASNPHICEKLARVVSFA